MKNAYEKGQILPYFFVKTAIARMKNNGWSS